MFQICDTIIWIHFLADYSKLSSDARKKLAGEYKEKGNTAFAAGDLNEAVSLQLNQVKF